jgi:hypothetical protein
LDIRITESSSGQSKSRRTGRRINRSVGSSRAGPVGWVAPVVLNSFFIAVDLLLDAIHRQVDRGMQLLVPIARDEVVLVFGIHPDFHFLVEFILQIDGDLDHRDPAEEMQEFLGLIVNFLLDSIGQVPMSGGDFDLHSREPPKG